MRRTSLKYFFILIVLIGVAAISVVGQESNGYTTELEYYDRV